MFPAYVEQCLVATLKRNDIVVMDNASTHKSSRIRKAIENARAPFATCPVCHRPQSHCDGFQPIQNISAVPQRGCRSRVSPRRSGPTMWLEFLPRSMLILVATPSMLTTRKGATGTWEFSPAASCLHRVATIAFWAEWMRNASAKRDDRHVMIHIS